MAATDEAIDQVWGLLADTGGDEREARMQARYQQLAALTEEDRTRRLVAMARAEYALPDDKLRSFTISRLRVWLRLEAEAARLLASSYDSAMSQLSGAAAMRRVALVQTLVREFSPEAQSRLRTLVPNVFGESPTPASRASITSGTTGEPSKATARKRWWPFWKNR